jgi:hypothetical protein
MHCSRASFSGESIGFNHKHGEKRSFFQKMENLTLKQLL